MIKHAAIVPLIGGEVIASMDVFETPPSYLLSYTPFMANEKHLVNWLQERGHSVPYYFIDATEPAMPKRFPKVDVVSTLCPCAGLSMLSRKRGGDNPWNDWMYRTAEYVLEKIRPPVFWGENAPTFGSDIGAKVRARMYEIGRKNGYSFTVYRTKTILHGGPQIRDRAFYFFWRDRGTPLMEYYHRPHERIEDTIINAKGNFQREVLTEGKPSEDPYYRYMLDVVMGGAKHRDFFNARREGKTVDIMSFVEEAGHTQKMMGEWMAREGYERESEKCFRRQAKRDDGKGYMYRTVVVPKDYIGAFVSSIPNSTTHPHEDRYINYREAMTIMGLPSDFELLDPRRNLNHICQNVPVATARDMATEIAAVLGGERQRTNSRYTFQWNHRSEHKFVRDESASLESFME